MEEKVSKSEKVSKLEDTKVCLETAMDNFNISLQYRFVCNKIWTKDDSLSLSDWKEEFEKKNILIKK